MTGIRIPVTTEDRGAKRQLEAINRSLANMATQADIVSKNLNSINTNAAKGYSRDFSKAGDSAKKFGKESKRAFKETGTETDRFAKKLNRLTNAFGLLIGVAGGLAIKKQFLDAGDAVIRWNNALKITTNNLDTLVITQQKLVNVSIRARAELDDTITTYKTLSLSLGTLGATERQIIRVTETLQKMAALSSGSAESIRSAFVQLNQGLGSELRGQELRAVLEQFDFLGRELRNELQLSAGELLKFAEAGNLTGEFMLNILLDLAEKTEKEFAKSTATFAQGVTRLKTSVKLFFGEISTAYGVTRANYNLLVRVAEGFDTIGRRLRIAVFELKYGTRDYFKEVKKFTTKAASVFDADVLRRTLNKLGNTIISTYEDTVRPTITKLFKNVSLFIATYGDDIAKAVYSSFLNIGEALGVGLGFTLSVGYALISAGYEKLVRKLADISFGGLKEAFINSIKTIMEGFQQVASDFSSRFAKGFLRGFGFNIDAGIFFVKILLSIRRALLDLNLYVDKTAEGLAKFVNALKIALSVVRDFAVDVIDFFFRIYDEVVGNSWWPDTIDEVVAKVTDLDAVTNFLERFFNTVIKGFKNVFKDVGSVAKRFNEIILESFEGVRGLDFSKFFGNLAENAVASLIAFLALFGKKLATKFLGFSFFFSSLNENLVKGLRDSLSVPEDEIEGLTENLVSSVVKGVKNLIVIISNNIAAIGRGIFKGIIDAFVDIPIIGTLLKQLSGLFLDNNVISGIVGAFAIYALVAKNGLKNVLAVIRQGFKTLYAAVAKGSLALKAALAFSLVAALKSLGADELFGDGPLLLIAGASLFGLLFGKKGFAELGTLFVKAIITALTLPLTILSGAFTNLFAKMGIIAAASTTAIVQPVTTGFTAVIGKIFANFGAKLTAYTAPKSKLTFADIFFKSLSFDAGDNKVFSKIDFGKLLGTTRQKRKLLVAFGRLSNVFKEGFSTLIKNIDTLGFKRVFQKKFTDIISVDFTGSKGLRSNKLNFKPFIRNFTQAFSSSFPRVSKIFSGALGILKRDLKIFRESLRVTARVVTSAVSIMVSSFRTLALSDVGSSLARFATYLRSLRLSVVGISVANATTAVSAKNLGRRLRSMALGAAMSFNLIVSGAGRALTAVKTLTAAGFGGLFRAIGAIIAALFSLKAIIVIIVSAIGIFAASKVGAVGDALLGDGDTLNDKLALTYDWVRKIFGLQATTARGKRSVFENVIPGFQKAIDVGGIEFDFTDFRNVIDFGGLDDKTFERYSSIAEDFKRKIEEAYLEELKDGALSTETQKELRDAKSSFARILADLPRLGEGTLQEEIDKQLKRYYETIDKATLQGLKSGRIAPDISFIENNVGAIETLLSDVSGSIRKLIYDYNKGIAEIEKEKNKKPGTGILRFFDGFDFLGVRNLEHEARQLTEKLTKGLTEAIANPDALDALFSGRLAEADGYFDRLSTLNSVWTETFAKRENELPSGFVNAYIGFFNRAVEITEEMRLNRFKSAFKGSDLNRLGSEMESLNNSLGTLVGQIELLAQNSIGYLRQLKRVEDIITGTTKVEGPRQRAIETATAATTTLGVDFGKKTRDYFLDPQQNTLLANLTYFNDEAEKALQETLVLSAKDLSTDSSVYAEFREYNRKLERNRQRAQELLEEGTSTRFISDAVDYLSDASEIITEDNLRNILSAQGKIPETLSNTLTTIKQLKGELNRISAEGLDAANVQYIQVQSAIRELQKSLANYVEADFSFETITSALSSANVEGLTLPLFLELDPGQLNALETSSSTLRKFEVVLSELFSNVNASNIDEQRKLLEEYNNIIEATKVNLQSFKLGSIDFGGSAQTTADQLEKILGIEISASVRSNTAILEQYIESIRLSENASHNLIAASAGVITVTDEERASMFRAKEALDAYRDSLSKVNALEALTSLGINDAANQVKLISSGFLAQAKKLSQTFKSLSSVAEFSSAEQLSYLIQMTAEYDRIKGKLVDISNTFKETIRNVSDELDLSAPIDVLARFSEGVFDLLQQARLQVIDLYAIGERSQIAEATKIIELSIRQENLSSVATSIADRVKEGFQEGYNRVSDLFSKTEFLSLDPKVRSETNRVSKISEELDKFYELATEADIQFFNRNIDRNNMFGSEDTLGSFQNVISRIATDNAEALRAAIGETRDLDEQILELEKASVRLLESINRGIHDPVQRDIPIVDTEARFGVISESFERYSNNLVNAFRAENISAPIGIIDKLIKAGLEFFEVPGQTELEPVTTRDLVENLTTINTTLIQGFSGKYFKENLANNALPERRASGGYISGPGGPVEDKIPAMLSNGEFVINAKSTKKFRKILEQINGGVYGFNTGGIAGNLYGSVDESRQLRTIAATPGILNTQNLALIFQALSEEFNELGIRIPFVTANMTKLFDAETQDRLKVLQVRLEGYKEDLREEGEVRDRAQIGIQQTTKAIVDLTRATLDYAEAVVAAGQQFSDSIKNSFGKALKGVFKGESFKDVGLNLLTAFQDNIIDTVVNGVTERMFTAQGTLDSFFTQLGSALFGNSESGPTSQGSGTSGSSGGMLDWLLNPASQPTGTAPGPTTSNNGVPSYLRPNAQSGGEGSTSDAITGPLNKMVDNTAMQIPLLSSLGNVFKDGLSGLANMFSGLFSGGGSGGGMDANAMAGLIGVGIGYLIDSFADGGAVEGKGSSRSDSILARVSNGEYIINAKSAAMYRPLLDKINAGNISKFADGGLVGTNSMQRHDKIKPREQRNNTVVNLQITGDISRQTKQEIYRMLPDIAVGVNQHNREIGY